MDPNGLETAGYSNSQGDYDLLPKLQGIDTGDKWYNNLFDGFVSYGLEGTYNLLATGVNTISNGIGAVGDLIKLVDENIDPHMTLTGCGIQADLDAITALSITNPQLFSDGIACLGDSLNNTNLNLFTKLGNTSKNNRGAKLTPAAQARNWQGHGYYQGIDNWTDTIFPEGSEFYRGSPNGTDFWSTKSAVENSGREAQKFFEGLQVLPHKQFGYRVYVEGYKSTVPLNGAISRALANPQISPGGLPQEYIPNSQQLIELGYLVPIETIKLIK